MKRGEREKYGVGPTRAPSRPMREDISGYPKRRSKFVKHGERANEAERSSVWRQTACGEKDDLRAPRLR